MNEPASSSGALPAPHADRLAAAPSHAQSSACVSGSAGGTARASAPGVPASGAAAGPNAAASPTFSLDGREIPFEPGETVLAATRRAGGYIPHLCWHPEFPAHGSCRICTVKVNGRAVAGCTTAAAAGQVVENRTPELDAHRKTLLQMLFVEGNHFCPSCEKSGDCLLQATAYEFGMEGPHFEEFYPDRPVDASHPELLLELNRCILCELCVRASRDVDQKNVFAIAGHGVQAKLVVDSPSGRLGDTTMAASDRAASICPVGVILHKGRGFAVPIGERRYDRQTVADPDVQEAS